jgi:uncharacterized membrane protein (DUF2068 family)
MVTLTATTANTATASGVDVLDTNVSATASAVVMVYTLPVGGYAVALVETHALFSVGEWVTYFGIVALCGTMLSLKRRIRKPKR